MRWTAALCAALLVGCGAAEEEPVELPGDYAAIIESETDCRQLQQIFDTAEGAADNMRERRDIERAKEFTAVMGAVNERMREVGCYDS